MDQNPDNDLKRMDIDNTIPEKVGDDTSIRQSSPNHNNYKRKKEKYCNNCGKFGHYFRECRDPITSYGIICFKITPYPLKKNQRLESNNIKYLAIRRRNTLSYVEFVRGKYKYTDIKFIKILFERMTIQEREDILTETFDELWNKLWINNKFKNIKKSEFNKSKKKYLELKAGVSVNSKYISIKSLMGDTESKYTEPEWTFPKGRRNIHENDLDCAQREFQEEASLNSKDYEVFSGLGVFPEFHIGTNTIQYRTIYYLARCISDIELRIDPNNMSQLGEVSAIGWFTFDEIYNKMLRKYPEIDDTKRCITEIHNKILTDFNPTL